MKYLWKEYPITVILCILCLLMIPISIVLYSVLGATKLDKGMLDYGTPAICVGIILFIFEMFAIKHSASKDDEDDKTKN